MITRCNRSLNRFIGPAGLIVGLLAAGGTGGQQAGLPQGRAAYVATGMLPSPHATQAAAAAERFVYAISNSAVVKYDRATGKELGKSRGQAEHLNSGFLWQGKLYCAHSNYPRKPHRSDLRVLDPGTMDLTIFHTFAEPPGSLTWAVRRGDHWWCHFAHYGADKGKSILVRYDARWQEQARWTYPAALIADWGNYSLSGGIWDGDRLLATGHDRKAIYRLRVPAGGKVVEVIDVVPSPFPGQGIAADPQTGGLVGIDRAKRQVVFARLERR
ncbi:MAG: endonuclease [Gemmataceae bacterium]|nr:endonuclease [Gemmataceae bacterium]